MEKSVLEAIEKFSLLGDRKTVTVALSGGADSVAMLYCLLSLKDRLGITVKAAHLNHLIRGEEAFRDEDFVKNLCEKLSVELTVKREDIPLIAKQKGLSTELAAREVRYEFLREVAGDGVVATAHTASDNLETVLFNLTRGSGIDGLSGIPPKRDIFIRPIILCTRDMVEGYCEEHNISYVTDSTNLSDDYTRNKIRHNIVPVLKDINPSVETAVLRTSVNLREDAFVLENEADEFLKQNLTSQNKLSLKGFENLETAVGKRVIKKFIESVNSEISLENIHIENAFKTAISGGRTSLPKNCSLVSSRGFLFLETEKDAENSDFFVNLTECDNEFYNSCEKINNLFLNSSLNCDKIVGKLVIRTRNAGDSIRVAGRGCTKTLNKIFSEKAIPVAIRDKIPVISDDCGVVWVYGVGVAQRCAVNNSSKHIIKIEVKKKDGE